MSARKVSNEMHKTEGEATAGAKGFTHMAMQFGQFLAHDITLTTEGGKSEALQKLKNLNFCTFVLVLELECCRKEILEKDKTEHSSIQRCFNIDVENDPSFEGPDACYPFTR